MAYATLSETNQAIVRSAGEAEMLQRVCTIAVDFGGYLGAWIGLVDARTGEVKPVASHGPIEAYVSQLRLSVDPTRPEGQGPAGLAIRSGLPRYCDDFLADPATVPWQEKAREFGIRAHVVLPLRRGGAVAGVLTLCAAEPGAFDTQTRSLLEEMAVDVSFALDNFDRKAALAEWTERYEATVKASGQILLDRDLATGGLKLGGDAWRILGYREDELAGAPGRWAGHHPPRRPRGLRRRDGPRRAGGPALPPPVPRGPQGRRDGRGAGRRILRSRHGGRHRRAWWASWPTSRNASSPRIASAASSTSCARWHSAMLGREVRILQLKREVNEALAQAGRPPRYASPQADREERAIV